MVPKVQWKPFWLATQLYPQNDWTGWQYCVNCAVFAQTRISTRERLSFRAWRDPYNTSAHCSVGEMQIVNRPRKEGPSKNVMPLSHDAESHLAGSRSETCVFFERNQRWHSPLLLHLKLKLLLWHWRSAGACVYSYQTLAPTSTVQNFLCCSKAVVLVEATESSRLKYVLPKEIQPKIIRNISEPQARCRNIKHGNASLEFSGQNVIIRIYCC